MNDVTVIESGAVLDISLNRLKKSPKNARKVGHGEAAIEALEAVVAARGGAEQAVRGGSGQPL